MESNLTIKHMQPCYRPDEKFCKFGAASLTSAELLAIILRTGSQDISSVRLCETILFDEICGDEDILKILNLDRVDLMKIKGIGNVKALQIKAVAELSKRISMADRIRNVNFNVASTVADYYMEDMRHRKTEVVLLLLLNSSCELLKEIYLSSGTVNASIFSAREIFMEALKYEAVNMILIHNHPGGDPHPSRSDIESTITVMQAGKILGIRLVDHIIIGDRVYYSLVEEGNVNE